MNDIRATIGFMNVKPGDRVRRVLAEQVPMDLYVVKVDERLIYGALSGSVDPDKSSGSVWTFDRATGIEEDEDLGWGMRYGTTGSRLIGVL
jgi:hypothetical protein